MGSIYVICSRQCPNGDGIYTLLYALYKYSTSITNQPTNQLERCIHYVTHQAWWTFPAIYWPLIRRAVFARFQTNRSSDWLQTCLIHSLWTFGNAPLNPCLFWSLIGRAVPVLILTNSSSDWLHTWRIHSLLDSIDIIYPWPHSVEF